MVAMAQPARSALEDRRPLADPFRRRRAVGEFPFIKFFTSDFLAASAGLSATETGILITVLCRIYEHDGPITRDDTRLARVCGCPKPAFRKALTALLESGTITEEQGRLSSTMAEKQLIDRRNRTQKGTDAAHARWHPHEKKTEENQSSAFADARSEHCSDDASQSPESRFYGSGGGSAPADTAQKLSRLPPSSEHGQISRYRERLILACGGDPTSGLVGPNGARLGIGDQMIVAQRWLTDLGLTEDQVIETVTKTAAEKRDGPPVTLAYFTRPLKRLAGQITDAKTRPMEASHVDRTDRPRGGGNSVSSRPAANANSESQRIAEFARVRAARRQTHRSG